MRNTLLGLALLVTSCASMVHTTQELLVSRHAVKVETPFGLGSGFPITNDAYLTAWHVVDGWRPELVTVEGVQVEEILRLGELDVALLNMSEPHGMTPWPIEDRAASPGETVYKSGYGQGLHWWTEGIATEDADRLALDVFSGDSGGPIFDTDGDVIGIVVSLGMSHRGVITHHCWYVPMSAIVPELPEGLLDEPEEPLLPVPAAIPAPETPWERFQRLKKERGV